MFPRLCVKGKWFMNVDIELAAQWLAKARNDLPDADNNLAAAEIPFDTVCFHCQQAAEKLLKGYLVGKRVAYPITHNLFMIMEHILPLRSDVETLRDTLERLNPYAVEIRYPGDTDMPEEQDALSARQAAGEVLAWLTRALPELFD